MEMILHSAEKMPDSPKRCGRIIKPETEHIAARHQGISSTTFFILFYVVLFYIILFYIILFYIIFYFVLFYILIFCIIVFHFILFYVIHFFVLCSSILSISIFYSVVLYSFKCYVTEVQISYHVVVLLLRFISIHYFKGYVDRSFPTPQFGVMPLKY